MYIPYSNFIITQPEPLRLSSAGEVNDLQSGSIAVHEAAEQYVLQDQISAYHHAIFSKKGRLP